MLECLFVTCSELPDLDPDDRLGVEALAAVGVRVRPAIWTDARIAWHSTDACVIRSAWDYHQRPTDFQRWLETVSASTRLVNPADVVRWNAHKFYLRDLERQGVAIVPSEWLYRGAPFDLGEILRRRGWSDIVIKPSHGASAHGVLRVSATARQVEIATIYLVELLAEQDAIVQPYLRSVATHHERALVFFGGEYSHAVTKTPFMHAGASVGDRAHAPPGASGERPVTASDDEIALARQALQAAPRGHAYARVDLVRGEDQSIRVLELELIEPTLYLFAHPQAPQRFARALLPAIQNCRRAALASGEIVTRRS